MPVAVATRTVLRRRGRMSGRRWLVKVIIVTKYYSLGSNFILTHTFSSINLQLLMVWSTVVITKVTVNETVFLFE